MPRKNLIRQNEFPYHVTTRTNNKEWFSIPKAAVWHICKESLIYALDKVEVEINCFILMDNHYHLLITTPNSNLDEFMQFFNLKLSKMISKYSGTINHKFSNRYKWSIVSNKNYLFNVYRYIYQNPVRAGISNNCISYPFSSLKFTSKDKMILNYEPHVDYESEKAWIEKRYGDEFDNIIRKSLMKSEFSISSRIPKFYKEILSQPRT